MRTIVFLTGAAFLGGVICFGFADESFAPGKAKRQDGDSYYAVAQATTPQIGRQRRPTEPTAAPPAVAAPEKAAVAAAPETKRPADEAAIRQASKTLVEAYGRGDASAIAALFTTDAEFVDELGDVYQGRQAIEKPLTEFFADNPDCTLAIEIESIRFVTPNVAVEDGRTTVTQSAHGESFDSRYSTVHVKIDGRWLAASLRDQAPKERQRHRAQLQQLAWLNGDWIDEGDDSLVLFSCRPVDDGNFLLRTFTIQIAGQEVMSGTQRIGWDPATGKLRAWIFDSLGGYGEGLWHQDGDDWVLKTTGVTADGQAASSTSIYKRVSADSMTWQSLDHEIAGVQMPDSELVTIVRRAPPPASAVLSTTVADDAK